MMMMMMADEEWARVNDLNLVVGCAQCLTLILLQAELCCVGLVRFSLSCVGHPLFIMMTQQQVLDQRAGQGEEHIWITLNLLELHIRSGRKSLLLHHINAAWIISRFKIYYVVGWCRNTGAEHGCLSIWALFKNIYCSILFSFRATLMLRQCWRVTN